MLCVAFFIGMLNVIRLSVVILNVVTLSVVAPIEIDNFKDKWLKKFNETCWMSYLMEFSLAAENTLVFILYNFFSSSQTLRKNKLECLLLEILYILALYLQAGSGLHENITQG